VRGYFTNHLSLLLEKGASSRGVSAYKYLDLPHGDERYVVGEHPRSDAILHDGLQLSELPEVLETQVEYFSKRLHDFLDHIRLLEVW
jgi:hypothetical protein